MTRKLVTIKTITDIQPIPDANAIEVATVDHGWKVVVKKSDYFTVGEEVLYFETDSWIPQRVAPFLSRGQEPREYNGVKGERLRTIRLKQQISQGLILRFQEFGGVSGHFLRKEDGTILMRPTSIQVTKEQYDGDFSLLLRVNKWEAPIPAQLSGKVKGNFPSWIPKTDQERCQNFYTEIFEEHQNEQYEITEKLEGTSMTVYVKDGEVGVCGRNWNLAEDYGNSLWAAAKENGLIEFLPNFGKNIAIQGELIGEGIQKNYYKIKGRQFYIFDMYNIDEGRYYTPKDRITFVQQCNTVHKLNLHHVPLIITDQSKIFENGMQSILAFAEGGSVINYTRQREGVVFKSHTSNFHWKAISNKFLLKTEKNMEEE